MKIEEFYHASGNDYAGSCLARKKGEVLEIMVLVRDMNDLLPDRSYHSETEPDFVVRFFPQSEKELNTLLDAGHSPSMKYWDGEQDSYNICIMDLEELWEYM